MSPEVVGDLLVDTLPWVTAGLTFGLTAGGVYLRTKYQHNKLVQALLILDQVVIDVVKELNRTVVEDLKAARADGKLTKDEAEQIKSKAIDLVLKRLSLEMFPIIQKSLGPLVNIIATKIEAVVFDQKKAKPLSRQVKVKEMKMIS